MITPSQHRTAISKSESEPAILYFGNDWSAENRTSSHQIARRLARHYRVYYIECPGLRAPKGTARDLRKIWLKASRFARGLEPAGENLHVQTLLQIPLHGYRSVRAFNRWLIRATLHRLMRRENIVRPISWFMVPHLASMAGALGERLSVYYCIDDYASLPDVDPVAVRAMDEQLTARADLVFVASATLLEAKRHLNPHTHVSPHGVDVEHFAAAQSEVAVPADTAGLKGPVVGFFGLIERWIDLSLIGYLATQLPDVQFVMIGRVAVPADELPRLPNIRWLGQRPYDQLPAYGKQFDAAIIPYRLTPQVLHANPIKLREYLAMGKPVVAVSTPEIERYADVVEIASGPEAFAAKLKAVLATKATQSEIKRRMQRVASESWERRLDSVLSIIASRQALDRSHGPACRKAALSPQDVPC